VKRNIDITKLRMFVGALVNAYSRLVIDAKFSENAMSTYLYAPSISIYEERASNSRATLNPHIQEGKSGFCFAFTQVAAYSQKIAPPEK
jgi:hypothetical protein